MRRPPFVSVALAVAGLSAAAVGVGVSVQAAGGGYARMTPVVAAVQRALPAVVSIVAESGGRRGTGMRGSGSGVIVHPSGYVVTNSHVIRGASRVYVSLAKVEGDRRAFQAAVLEDDPGHDLALLRIARAEPFPYVALTPTDAVMIGETAIAIGNPYGLGDTVTQGIVSAKGRTATLSSGQVIRNLFQTDASINLGNSGGALLNLDGELIGVNCSIHPSAQGIAFTVCGDDVQAMLDRNLGAAGRVPPPGATFDLKELEPSEPGPEALDERGAVPVPPAMPSPRFEPQVPSPAPPVAEAPAAPRVPPGLVLPPGRQPIGLMLKPHDGSVLISSVTPGSNADIAGLQAGDVILDVDGQAYATPQDVARVLTAAPSGRTFFFNIRRAGVRATAIVVAP